MRTESFKRTDIEESWVLLDAEGKTLGRFAAEVANVLSGKNKPASPRAGGSKAVKAISMHSSDGRNSLGLA